MDTKGIKPMDTYNMVSAFVDVYEGDDAKTLNRLGIYLEMNKITRSPEEWDWVMWLAEELYPPLATVHKSSDFSTISTVIDYMSKQSFTSIIYIANILRARGLWSAYSDWVERQ